VSEPTTRNHYSYTTYADPATARTFDDRRFGGPIGHLVAATQAATLMKFIGEPRGRRILDVGTGTGRAALLLSRAGAAVTAIDPSEEMLRVARQRAVEQRLDVVFGVGDAHALEFPDRTFDVVVSLRVLMHTPGWRTCLGEMCRVARELVIVDYPAACSAAAVQSIGRRMRHAAGIRTEPYRVFSERQIAGALQAFGFRVRSIERQFVLPIALHKAVGSRRFTTTSEACLQRVGLLRLFGSPVTIVAERCESS